MHLIRQGPILRKHSCSLTDYLKLYKARRKYLLRKRGRFPEGHPAPVATTWSLSFQRIKFNPAAVELLQLFAFLHPEAIPEEIITHGSQVLGPVLQTAAADLLALNAAIEMLLRFSLVHRDADAKTFTIHRLVQVILTDGMNEETQKLWAKRAIGAIEKIFPNVDFITWQLCQNYLPQAQICEDLIKRWSVDSKEAAQLLNRTALYLRQRGLYSQAEPLYQEALAINRKIKGPKHSITAKNLNDLGELYYDQGKYNQAEHLYLQALNIYENVHKLETSDGITTLNNLAKTYYLQHNYTQAEEFCEQALAFCKQHPEYKDSNLATALSLLASLFRIQNKNYEQAEPLYLQAIEIYKQNLGEKHPDVADTLNDLADLYSGNFKFAKAEPLYERALEIRKHTLGMDHPEVASSLYRLGIFYHNGGKYILAEPLFLQALECQERFLGPEHPEVANTLTHLAVLYLRQKKRGKYARAEPLLQRAIRIQEQRLGPEHPELSESLLRYAYILQKTKRREEASKLIDRAKEINSKHRLKNPTFEEEAVIATRRMRHNNYVFGITVGISVFLCDELMKLLVITLLPPPDSGHFISLIGNYFEVYYTQDKSLIYILPSWLISLSIILPLVGIPFSRRISRNHSNLVITRKIGARIHRTSGFVGFAGAIGYIIDPYFFDGHRVSSFSLYIPNTFHVYFSIGDIAFLASPLIFYSTFLLAIIEKILRWKSNMILLRKQNLNSL